MKKKLIQEAKRMQFLAKIISEEKYMEEGTHIGKSDMIITLDYDNEITKIEDKHYHHGPDGSTDYEIDTIESDFDYDDTMDIVKDLIEKQKWNKIILKVTYDGEEQEDEFDMGNWRGISYWIQESLREGIDKNVGYFHTYNKYVDPKKFKERAQKMFPQKNSETITVEYYKDQDWSSVAAGQEIWSRGEGFLTSLELLRVAETFPELN